MTKKIVVEIEFIEEVDEFEPDYAFIKFESINVISSQVSSKEFDGWAEMFLQSDYAFIEFPNEFVNQIEKGLE